MLSSLSNSGISKKLEINPSWIPERTKRIKKPVVRIDV